MSTSSEDMQNKLEKRIEFNEDEHPAETVARRFEQEEQKVKKEEFDAGATTELYSACVNGNLEEIRLALENRADPNGSITDGITPLQKAVVISSRSQLEIVDLLIESKAMLDTKDMCGNSALFFARQRHNQPIIDLLTSKGAKAFAYHKLI